MLCTPDVCYAARHHACTVCWASLTTAVTLAAAAAVCQRVRQYVIYLCAGGDHVLEQGVPELGHAALPRGPAQSVGDSPRHQAAPG